jgi:predicted HNH restriction endonuclease
MKAATTCIFNGEKLSIEDALELRDRSNEPLYFTCISCEEPVKPHKAGEEHTSAHFEHYERNNSCPHSDGKSAKGRYGINEKNAIEGYEIDKKLLTGSRNQCLAKQCKVRDKFVCQACGFKLKLNGKYIVECHHKHPIGTGEVRETTLDDLISLCPTCHRISHTRKEPLEINEIIEARKL